MPEPQRTGTTTGAARRDGVFYVTDRGFALPTIAGALAVRRMIPVERADVRIIMTDLASDVVARARDYLAPFDILVDVLPAGLFSDFNHREFNKTHVSMATLGRFFMLDCVPDIYRRVLYLDGDTWPVGDLAELFEAELGAGCLAAAEDQSFYYRHDRGATGASVRAYFAGLGIDGDQGYFNAGVLLADAGAWRDVSAEAFDFFRRNPARCRYHDQSALNAVAGARRVRLGPRWNYLAMYPAWGVRPEAAPRLLHFCGGAKPWKLPEAEFFPRYEAAFKALAGLGLAAAPATEAELQAVRRAAQLQQLKLNTLMLPRKLNRQRMYRQLCRDAAIA